MARPGHNMRAMNRTLDRVLKPLRDKEKMFPGSTNLKVNKVSEPIKKKDVNEIWPAIAVGAMRAAPHIAKAVRNPATIATAPTTVAQKALDMWRSATGKKKTTNEEAMTTADAGIPQDTKNMGPSRLPMNILRRKIGIPINVTDRRRKKDKPPKLRKKFRSFK